MDSHEVKGKIFVVTGGASGLGALMVKAIADAGAEHIAILDIAINAGNDLEAKLNTKYGNNRVKFYKCDVTNEEELLKAMNTTVKEEKHIDVVINNAGIMNDSKNVYRKQIDINVTALITSSLKALELMRKDTGGKGGTIINVSSVVGLSQISMMPIYSATKIAVLQFSNCLGVGTNLEMEQTYARTGVRVIAMCFGATDTSLLHGDKLGFIDQELGVQMRGLLSRIPIQRPDSAIQGVLEAYRHGKSGSTWLATNDKPPKDISQSIKDAFSLMTANIMLK